MRIQTVYECLYRTAAILPLLAAVPAFAGRPLTTEDASILDAKACQVEAWIDRSRSATQSWLVPACNFGADTEWQVGFARLREQGRSGFSEAYFQAKTLLPLPKESAWNAGLVVGVTRRATGESHRRWENPYLIVPVTRAVPDTPVLLHLNVGASHDRAERRTVTLWGAAVESPLAERITLVAEVYGENAAKPYVRGGMRVTAIRDQLDFDLTVVARPGAGHGERFVSVGITWAGSLLR